MIFADCAVHELTVRPGRVPEAAKFADLIKTSEKFIFSEDALRIAIQAYRTLYKRTETSNPSVLDYARLPYPTMWTEWENPHAIFTEMCWEFAPYDIKAIGFLFISMEHGWRLFNFLQYGDSAPSISKAVVEWDSSCNRMNFKCIRSEEAPDESFLLDHAQGMGGIGVIQLCALNTKNLFSGEEISIEQKRNRSRRKKKQPMLHDHKRLVLKLTRCQRNAAASRGMTESQMRAHLVRGHFKVRKTGMYWWSPFVRGNANKGILTKDYEVRN